jgi:hypothetical protein
MMGYDPFPAWTRTVKDSSWKQKGFELLPINGSVYNSSTGKWKCEISPHISSDNKGQACYNLKFEHEDHLRAPRNLTLRVSTSRLENDSEWRYKKAISDAILKWLDSNQNTGDIWLPA